MEAEDWVSFRSQAYKFEEYLTTWEEKLASGQGETTKLKLKLAQDIERFKAGLHSFRSRYHLIIFLLSHVENMIMDPCQTNLERDNDIVRSWCKVVVGCKRIYKDPRENHHFSQEIVTSVIR